MYTLGGLKSRRKNIIQFDEGYRPLLVAFAYRATTYSGIPVFAHNVRTV